SLHYKLPGKDTIITLPYLIQNNFTFLKDADSSLRFAAAVIMLGGLLKQSDLWKNYTWDDVTRIAKTAVNTNEYIQTEFLSLIEKARKIYAPLKKRKKDTGE
ncbi:MAG TPA: YfbK domain-containing protein, partial [Chitinophagaceae bacterium]